MEAISWVRSRRTRSRNEKDRISDLPDSVIQHILSFLPTTRDAVRTGILSKRWRNQWAHLPVLIFNCSRKSGEEYLRFVENTLLLHECPKIKKFHLEYGYGVVKDPQFTAKIRFSIRKCVEELILIRRRPDMSVLLPISLFDTASLVRLEMANVCFKPYWRVNLPSLKSLKLISGGPDNTCSEAIENIVSGCPLLECFEFRGCMLDGVAIFSKSLKVLSFIDVEVPATFTISCPNLVEFNLDSEYWENYCYCDKMFENILLGSPIIQSLKIVNCYGFHKLVIASTSLKILHLKHLQDERIEISCPNLEKLDILLSDIESVKVVNPPSSVCVTLNIEECYDDDLFKELLEQFQHVNKIIMERVFLEIVSQLYAEGHRLPQLNYKCLTLTVGQFILAIPGIAYALHSPWLESLVIKFSSKSCKHMSPSEEELLDLMISKPDYWNTHGSSGLTCLVSQLKTVEIIGVHETDDNCKFELEFIEFLLKSARELKKMTISLQKCTKDFVIEFSQKLVSFPRYSRFANVELLCST